MQEFMRIVRDAGTGGWYGEVITDEGELYFPEPGTPDWATLDLALHAASLLGYQTDTADVLTERFSDPRYPDRSLNDGICDDEDSDEDLTCVGEAVYLPSMFTDMMNDPDVVHHHLDPRNLPLWKPEVGMRVEHHLIHYKTGEVWHIRRGIITKITDPVMGMVRWDTDQLSRPHDWEMGQSEHWKNLKPVD